MHNQPYTRLVRNAKCAILFVHGILGTPDHFDPLLPYVPDSWSIQVLQLDGHHGDVRNFSRSRLHIWRQQVFHAAEELLKTHEQLYLCAHSMGTLFAIDAAIAHPDRIAGLFLLAAPFCPAPKLRILPGMLHIALGRIPAHDTWAQLTRKAYGLDSDPHLLRYLGWIPRYIELFAEILRIRRRVLHLTTPTCSLHSACDELLRHKPSQLLTRLPNVTLHILPHSGHYSYAEGDLRTIQNLLRTFLSQ